MSLPSHSGLYRIIINVIPLINIIMEHLLFGNNTNAVIIIGQNVNHFEWMNLSVLAGMQHI